MCAPGLIEVPVASAEVSAISIEYLHVGLLWLMKSPESLLFVKTQKRRRPLAKISDDHHQMFHVVLSIYISSQRSRGELQLRDSIASLRDASAIGVRA